MTIRFQILTWTGKYFQMIITNMLSKWEENTNNMDENRYEWQNNRTHTNQLNKPSTRATCLLQWDTLVGLTANEPNQR